MQTVEMPGTLHEVGHDQRSGLMASQVWHAIERVCGLMPK